MSRLKKIVPFLSLVIMLAACQKALRPVKLDYAGYSISENTGRDSALHNMLRPYHDSVEASMNKVVGTAAATLEKAMPSSSLGNFMADAVLHMSRVKFNRPVHFSLVNYGGIRSNQLPQGPVTMGKVFELMPFDNLMVLQELTGAQVQQLCDFLAGHGGWPVAGITFNIRNKKAIDIRIDGRPLDMQQTYTVSNSDYVANGGDGAAFLRDIPQISNGYLIRDALFEYISFLQQQKGQIEANNEKRINNVQ